MKPLLINTSDIEGGAARAAYRLHTGLRNIGIDSTMLVQSKSSDDSWVIGPNTKKEKLMAKVRPQIDSLPLKLHRSRQSTTWSNAVFFSDIAGKIKDLNPDIVHLHWVGGGFVPIKALSQINKPIVWTLHDMWAFTGGCHYAGECTRYMDSCGKCSYLNSKRKFDLSHHIWKQKAKQWKDINLTIVTCSRWLAECAGESALFKHVRVEVIPNGLDLNRYKPMDRRVVRELLGLPQEKKIIIFGAMSATSDNRKGFQFLQPALQILKGNHPKDSIELAVFGASTPATPPDFGFKVNYMGRFNDDISLALLYSCADVVVTPSMEDNLPNVVMEALACGIPCVTFNIGGIPDMIEHQKNGYLAKAFEINDLAMGISWVLSDETRWQKLSKRAREKVEQEFELETIAQKYTDLYENILMKKDR
jgi:glycosyltransferase involved in cell wall biosynthesis